MDAPHRSPILGYNHNVQYRGRVYHVQTEDSGPATHRVFTHLFFGGTILATKKIEYDPFAPEDVVKPIMQSQHKAVLRELKNALYDDKILVFFTAVGEAAFPSDPEQAAPVAAPAPSPPAVTAPEDVATLPPVAAVPPEDVVTPPPVAAVPPEDVVTPPPVAAVPPEDVVTPPPASSGPPRTAVAGVIEVPARRRPAAKPFETPPPMVVELQPPPRISVPRPAVLPLDVEPVAPNLETPSMPPLPSTVAPAPGAAPTRRLTPPRARTPVAGVPRQGAPRRTSVPGAQPSQMQPQQAVPVANRTAPPGSGVVIVQRNVVVGASPPPSSTGARPRPTLNYPASAAGKRPSSSYRSGGPRPPGGAAGGSAPSGSAGAPRRNLDVQFSFPSERHPASPDQPAGEQDKGMDDIILEFLSEDQQQGPKKPEK